MNPKHVLGHPCAKAVDHVVDGATVRYVKRNTCVACAAASTTAWAARNPSAAKERKAAQRARNPGKDRAYNVVWESANPELVAKRKAKWREANPDKYAEYQAAYQEAHPEKLAARNAARRAAELQRTPSWADARAIEQVYLRAAKKSAAEHMHVDHIIPLQGRLVSGLHVAANLRIIPRTENLRKGAKFDPWAHVHVLPAGPHAKEAA